MQYYVYNYYMKAHPRGPHFDQKYDNPRTYPLLSRLK